MGIEFSIIDRDKQYKVQCAAEIEKKDGPKPFYGIRCHKKCEVYVVHNILEREDLTTDFPESDNYYPIWKYCDINDLVENTYNLALKIIAIANDPNSGFKL